jgi:transposase-like protein
MLPPKVVRRFLTPEKHAKIIAALKANPYASAVAREIGSVSSVTVWKIAKQEGIDLTAGKAAQGKPGLPPENRAKIIAALKANPNARAVAEEIGGVSSVTVWKIAKQIGIDLTAGKAAQGWPRLPPEKRAKIIAALKTNPHAKAVAKRVGGVGTTTVVNIARQMGIVLTAGYAARRQLPPEKRAKIIAALKVNPNANAVARQVGGVCRATVGKIAKQTGIKLTDGKPAGRGAKQKAPAKPNHTHKC